MTKKSKKRTQRVLAYEYASPLPEYAVKRFSAAEFWDFLENGKKLLGASDNDVIESFDELRKRGLIIDHYLSDGSVVIELPLNAAFGKGICYKSLDIKKKSTDTPLS